MKTPLAILLTGSLLLNAALVALFLVPARPVTPTVVAATTNGAGSKAVDAPIDPETWPKLESKDMKELVARLRDSGFPPAMVRAVLMAQMEEEYVARRRAALPNADSAPFWKNATLDPQTELALRQLSAERQKRMRELLGTEGENLDPFNRVRQNRQLSHLPPEKADQVRQLFSEFQDMRNDVYTNFVGGMLGPAEREKMSAIEKRQNEAIAKVLTPQEFEEFELRGSNTANRIRSQLVAFDATEEEFRTMYRLQKPYDDQFGPMYAPPSPEEQRKRSELQRQINEQIKTALGPVRAAEYERATNYEFQRTTQLAARLQLPPEAPAQVWALQQDVQKRARDLHTDQGLTAQQRNEQLIAIHNEATAKLTPILGGSRGMEAYKLNGGSWLTNLVPRPSPPGSK
jgi:hypothetical protein